LRKYPVKKEKSQNKKIKKKEEIKIKEGGMPLILK